MKIKLLLVLALGLGLYIYLFPQYQPESLLRSTIHTINSKISPREIEIDTFEISYPENEIAAKMAKALPTEKHTLNAGKLLYTPCLLLEVKYNKNGRSTETAEMLWDLLEGEMILSTDHFQETSGFCDCLKSKANIDDFRMLHTLASRGGAMSQEALIQQSGIDEGRASSIIESLRYRHLITVTTDGIRLHVKNPLFRVDPETKMTRHIVQRKIQSSCTVPETFSESQIESLIQSAYGKDIAILESSFIWIPVWQMDITNPDGSMRRTFWNALSGKEMGVRSSSTLVKSLK